KGGHPSAQDAGQSQLPRDRLIRSKRSSTTFLSCPFWTKYDTVAARVSHFLSSSERLDQNRSPNANSNSTFNHCRPARSGGALKCRSSRAIACLQFGQGNGRSGISEFQFDDPSCLKAFRHAKQAKCDLFVAVGSGGFDSFLHLLVLAIDTPLLVLIVSFVYFVFSHHRFT